MSRLRKNAHSFVCKFSKRLLLNHCREDRRKFCIFAVGFWHCRSRNFFKRMDNFDFPKFCRFRKTTGKNSVLFSLFSEISSTSITANWKSPAMSATTTTTTTTTTKASSRTKHKFTSCEKQVRHSFSLFFLNWITGHWNVVAVDPVVVVMSFFLFFCISVPCTDSATWVIFFSVEWQFASQKSEWSVRWTACPGLRFALMHGQSVEDFIVLVEEQFKSRVGQQCWWTDNEIGGRVWLMEKELF